ncbi:MAG: selenoneine biosynthesis selenosugar synthase SenB [Acidimicrobiales bacterium]
MKITIVTPRRPGVASGNDVTSARWAARLGELGHSVALATVDESGAVFDPQADDVAEGADLLVVLHARRCASAVAASRSNAPNRPVVVGLAGTDLYKDLPDNAVARASIDAADRLVVLQAAAIGRLGDMAPQLAAKAHVVYQSVEPPLPARSQGDGSFVVVVLAHLRDVKDPLLAAEAVRLLPDSSAVTVLHAGHAHDDIWHERASAEAAANERYRWLGEVDRDHALELLATATVLACTSRLEGGANVVSEAIAMGVPVVGTAIDGNYGLLGMDYPGLVPVGDATALGGWLNDLETRPALLDDLVERVRDRVSQSSPATERAGWKAVLNAIDQPMCQ